MFATDSMVLIYKKNIKEDGEEVEYAINLSGRARNDIVTI